ncbi:DNA/RNA polymerases superfamily protein [Hibiscus syriacus]|uniref:DNA/RNA polymerases superfamily protein n=1 Tax=Hibiscus syriacus TaxID=106335 RepID=A0A6A2WUI3_HIBSY|nr:uncharacterized protein LOC120191512 [Hibiscus syriacus]KAE8658690.1 DNA/RNA polymerases superfamily protein [Hibiscus syriacus]
MMLKFFAWFIVLSCATALSSRKLEGFPLLKPPDFNLSGSVVQGHDDTHVLKHAGLNSSAKVDEKDEYYKQHYKIFQSEKSKGGKGAYGGANVPHHPNKKNAAPPLLNPPCFLFTVALHAIFTLILSSPALFLTIF